MSSLGEAVLSLGADDSKLNAALASAKSKVASTLSGMGGGFAAIGSSLSSLGGTITRSVTLPLLAVGAGLGLMATNALKTGADFEKAMSGVSAILGATEEQAKRLSNMAITLGMDPKLVVSTQEAAQVMEELAKNGLTADQIMDGAARSAIALANATGTDFATAAQVASTAMQLFNLDATQMASIVNNITGVANTSRFSVEDFAQAMAMGGGVAASMGIPIEDFATAVAGLSTSFSSGSDAGTSFKVFLQRLVPETKKAKEMMADLGIVTDEAGNRFFDAEGNMKSLSEIAGILQVAFKDLSDEQKIQALHTLFGTDAMRAANAMANLGAEGFDKLSEAMAKTDAAGNAATRMNNLAGAVEILSGIVEGFKIKFTQAVGPGMRSMVETFSGFLSENSVTIENLFASLATVFDGFAANFGTWLNTHGPEVIAFFQKMIDNLPKFIEQLVKVGTTAAPHLQKLFDAFMNAKPETIVKIMEAIAGLAVLGPVLSAIGGFITALVSIGTVASTVAGGISSLASVFWSVSVAIGTAITGGILLPLLVIIGTVALVYLAFKNNFGGIRTTAEQLFFILGYGATQAVEKVRTTFAGLGTTLSQLWAIIKFGAEQGWNAIVEYLKSKAVEAYTNMKNFVADIRKTFDIDWTELGNRIIDGLVAGLMNGVNAVVDAATSVAQAAYNAAKNVLGIQSPSRAFASLGDMSGVGFTQGLQKSLAPQKVAGIMNRVVAGAGQAVSKNMTNTVNVYNPKAEPASRSVESTLKKMSYIGILKP
jgi:TP901 family phage tail tape measure protein